MLERTAIHIIDVKTVIMGSFVAGHRDDFLQIEEFIMCFDNIYSCACFHPTENTMSKTTH